MKRAGVVRIGGALLAGVLTPCAFAAPDAAVSGTVRNADGAPQMGALIELLGPHAALIAQAVTDEQGHYLLRIARAGIYQLRASSAFLAPALQPRLVLRSGTHAVADLTLPEGAYARKGSSAEARPTEWHPDDWRWVLRSAANRPLLRLVDSGPADTDSSSASSSVAGSPEVSGTPSRRLSGELRLAGSRGGFGQLSSSQMLSVDYRRSVDESTRVHVSWNAVTGTPTDAGLQLQRNHAGGAHSRLAMLVGVRPELVGGSGAGYRVLRSAAAETFTLGDLVQVDVGTLLTAEQLEGTRVTSSPYLRLGVAPTPGILLEYRYASDRMLQQASDMEAEAVQPEVLANAAGNPVPHAGSHHEVAATRTLVPLTVHVGLYRDELPVQGLQGTGVLTAATAEGEPVVVDTATRTFRIALRGLASEGFRAGCSHSFHSGDAVAVEGAFGRVVRASTAVQPLEAALAGTSTSEAGMVRGTMHLAGLRTGSSVDVSYRWQPRWSLSQVDAFDADSNEAYLGFDVVQQLWTGPHGEHLEAVFRASNLLAEGYVPVMSADGRTLYLAQVPRMLQAGLGFRF